MEKIVAVTAGGPIASFHAGMEVMSSELAKTGRFELYGAVGGIEGLLAGELMPLPSEIFEINRAGSLIGADRKHTSEEKGDFGRIKEIMKSHNIYAIIMMGGDNHLGEAAKWHKYGINVVGYPKTMDGDLSSYITCGYPTAVTIGAQAAHRHHHNAMTTRGVFYVGLFGRNTDWVLTGVTAYGGADFGIPCEETYSWETILEHVQTALARNKEEYGVPFAVVPFSEGAKIEGVQNPPDYLCTYDAHGLVKLHPEWLGMQLVYLTKKSDIRAAMQTYTYSMRDSRPTVYDEGLSRWAGLKCVQLIVDGNFGQGVVYTPTEQFFATHAAPLEEIATQRAVKGTGFFDYDALQATPAFLKAYRNAFYELAIENHRDTFVYKHMVPERVGTTR